MRWLVMLMLFEAALACLCRCHPHLAVLSKASLCELELQR